MKNLFIKNSLRFIIVTGIFFVAHNIAFAQFVSAPTVTAEQDGLNITFSLSNDYTPTTPPSVQYNTDYAHFTVGLDGSNAPNENACMNSAGSINPENMVSATLTQGSGAGPYTFFLATPAEPNFCLEITTDSTLSYGPSSLTNSNPQNLDPGDDNLDPGDDNLDGGDDNLGSNNNGGGSSIGLNNPLAGSGIDSIQGLIKAILDIALTIGIPIVALAIIYAGFLFVSARGNTEKLEKAKDALLYTIIGAAILLGSWVIANAIHTTISALQ